MCDKARGKTILPPKSAEMSQAQVPVYLIAVYSDSKGNAANVARITQGTSEAGVSNRFIRDL